MTHHTQQRASDGATYLVIADDSDEFPIALRYALRLAQARRGHIAVASVMEDQDFSHWGGVEAKIRQEQRRETEEKLWKIGRIARELTGHIPALHITEGDSITAVTDIIENDNTIHMMILANGASGPGPLVSHFAVKQSGKIRIPVLIVPGHLADDDIDILA